MRLARARNLVVGIYGMVLVASLVAGPAYAGQSSVSGMVSSSGMAAVASGTVTSASGAAMPGTAVELLAWPPDAVLRALKPGDPVPTKLLATATTTPTGSYMLQVPLAQLKAAAVESGNANLEVFSAVGGSWFLPYQTGSLPGRPPAPVTVNLSSNSKPSCGINPHGRPYSFSNFAKQRNRPETLAIVGQAYIVHSSKTVGDSVGFSYAQGASSSQSTALGIGISGYGFDAGYNSAGTHSSTARAAEGFPTVHENSLFRTNFSVGQFRGICYGPANDTSIPYQKQHGQCPRKYVHNQTTFYVHKCLWLIHDTGWSGGENIQHPKSAPHVRYCESFPATGTFKSDFGKAVQWSSGFNLGETLGIKGANLKASFNSSAQTGYDKDALLNFTFAKPGVLCGTNHKITRAAILVQLGAKP